MADRIKLDFENRTLVGKKVNRLRRQGLLPATVYGKGVGPFTVQLNARTFADAYRHAGRTGLLDLGIPGQKGVSAFIHNLQRHPVTRAITHVDFLVVDLLIEVTVDVPVHIVGDSELVRGGDALLNQARTALSLRARPTDSPSAIQVDDTALDSMDKSIRVADISLEKGEFAAAPDELVVSLTPARDEEVEEEPAAEGEPELVREDRDEDAEAE